MKKKFMLAAAVTAITVSAASLTSCGGGNAGEKAIKSMRQATELIDEATKTLENNLKEFEDVDRDDIPEELQDSIHYRRKLLLDKIDDFKFTVTDYYNYGH